MVSKKQFIQREYKRRLADPLRHDPGNSAREANQDPKHVTGQARVKGNLARGSHSYMFAKDGELKRAYLQSYYAWNAWNYIGSADKKSDRNIYNHQLAEYRFFNAAHRPNFYQTFPTPALGTWAQVNAQWQQATNPDLRRYYGRKKSILFLSQHKGKRTQFIGATLPYPWEAHHLLPTNVFYNYFTLEHLKLILRSDYDVNDGRNIIFLPRQPVDTHIHGLPYHYTGHSEYDERVKEKLLDLRNVLDQIKLEKLKHEQADKSVEEELHKVETEMFKCVKAMGRKSKQKLT